MDARTERLARIYGERHRRLRRTVPEDDIVLAYLRKFLPEDGRARLLDAGCGSGRYAQTLAEAGYERVVGVDVTACDSADSFSYVRGDIGRLPFGSGSFDFVYCNSVIYHLERPDLAIREIARVTANGGLFLMTAHTPRSLFTYYRRTRMLLNNTAFDNIRGVGFPSASDYAIWLGAQGFRVVLVDGYSLLRFRERAKQLRLALQRRLPWVKCLRWRWRGAVTRYRWLARLKSTMGYHMILVARRS